MKRDHARVMNELARIGDVRSVSVFCVSFPKFVYQVKKQYSTANTVLLLPLTTKRQYHTALNSTNIKINNSTTVPHGSNLQQHFNNSKVPYIHRSAPIRYTCLTPCEAPCCARSVLYTRYPHKNCPGISTLYRRYIFFMRHLQHQDIDGHLLRLYIIFMRRRLYHERHGTANVWRSPSTTRTRAIGTKCFCFVFVFVFFPSRSF